jgi:uncharacterized protein
MDFAEYSWAFVGVTFGVAGFVKGVIGMGLPTVAMGLLCLSMPAADAAAILVIPSLVTNVWQLLAGPALRGLIRRMWGMLLGVTLGTVVATGLLVKSSTEAATISLGVALILYALSGLAGLKFTTAQQHDIWVGQIVGAMTGMVTGATGVFVLPAVPYLQSLRLEKEELVQALGLSFTVSTIALAAGLMRMSALHMSSAGLSAASLGPALGGMFLGQVLRRRISAGVFRVVFFYGLLLLGLYLAIHAA